MNANIENQNQNPQNPNPHADRDSREEDDEDTARQEQKEERESIIEERNRMVKNGELIIITLTPDPAKPADVFIRYYSPTIPTRHYVLTNGRHKDD